MQCEECGMSIPEYTTECVNCARPKKDRIVSMRGDFKPPKVKPKVKKPVAKPE